MPVVRQRQVLVCGSRQCRRAVLGQGCLAHCDARLVLGSRRAENCGRPTVAVPDPGGGDARGDSTGCSFGRVLHARTGGDASGDSTGAVLGPGLHAVGQTVQKTCDDAAGAVLGQGVHSRFLFLRLVPMARQR